MGTPAAATVNVGTAESSSYDAIVIGAGVSGLYQLHKLRELGLRVRVFEAGAAVGGTWYWNRYPGARFDSESHTYGYSFSQELLDEWDWAERFAAQPDTERYLNHVADKFDLRRDIQFNSRVAAAQYREEARSWVLSWKMAAAIPRASWSPPSGFFRRRRCRTFRVSAPSRASPATRT